MKTQRRHELQTNQLADHIGIWLRRIRPYQKHILYGAVSIVVIVAAVLYLNAQQHARAGASWEDYFSAMIEQRPEALDEVARLHSGSTAALWARLAAADMKLTTGAALLFQDRREAQQKLKEAERDLLALELDAAGSPMLLQRTRYGSAQVYEALFEVDKARDYYRKVIAADPDSALGQLAQRRHDQIADKDMDRWFAWFERQVPRPPAGAMPAGDREPDVPFDLSDLPTRPDPSFPGGGAPGQPEAMPAEETSEPAEAAPKAGPAVAPGPQSVPEPEPKSAPDPEPKGAPEPEPTTSEAASPAEEPEP